MGRHEAGCSASIPAERGSGMRCRSSGLKLTDEQIEEAYLRFLTLADRKKHVTAAI